jgi:hypothetical protein
VLRIMLRIAALVSLARLGQARMMISRSLSQ